MNNTLCNCIGLIKNFRRFNRWKIFSMGKFFLPYLKIIIQKKWSCHFKSSFAIFHSKFEFANFNTKCLRHPIAFTLGINSVQKPVANAHPVQLQGCTRLNLRFEVAKQKKHDEKGCECFMPRVKDGWIDGIFHIGNTQKAVGFQRFSTQNSLKNCG